MAIATGLILTINAALSQEIPMRHGSTKAQLHSSLFHNSFPTTGKVTISGTRIMALVQD